MNRTFEDRLLSELKREVALGAGDRPEPARWRSRAFVRRSALGLAACGVAAATATLIPSPADTPAYAVEQNPDGTITLKLEEWSLERSAQRDLARKLRPLGVAVTIDNPPPGMQCQYDRGTRPPVNETSPRNKFLLHKGDTLIMENFRPAKGESSSKARMPQAGSLSYVKGKSKPCKPVPMPDAPDIPGKPMVRDGRVQAPAGDG